MKARRVAMVAVAVLVASAAVALAAMAPTGHDAKRAQYVVKSSEFRPRPGSVRIEARADDPGGDAPWVVRVWRTADNSQACEQLGRLVNGVVGDVGSDGRFRALRLGDRTICDSRVFDRHAPIVQVATFLDDPLARSAKPLRTVAWGMAGPRAASVTINGPGGTKTARPTPLHAWLDVRAGSVRTYELATTVRYADNTTRTVDYSRSRRPSREPVPGSVTVEARAESPGAGPDVGLLAWRTPNGSICSTDGRLLGSDRVGGWSDDSTFFDFPIGAGGICHRSVNDTGYLPVDFSYGFNAGSPAHFSGFARADVVAVVLEGVGPRIELTPGPKGGLLAVFPAKSGDLRVTVRFKDGREQQLPSLHISPFRVPRPGPVITRIRPKVARVTPDGHFTVLATCAAHRHGTRGKCMTSMFVLTAKGYTRGNGLTRHFQVASRLVRIGAGTRDRPLRLRLSDRGRALVARHGFLDVVISSHGLGGKPKGFPVRLVSRARAVPTRDVRVDPARAGQADVVFVRWRVRRPMDSNLDGYSVVFKGPGGSHCSTPTSYLARVTWSSRYNERYATKPAGVGLPPRRSAAPAGGGHTWCPGKYRGKVVFHDHPRGPGPETVHRVGLFEFRVKTT